MSKKKEISAPSWFKFYYEWCKVVRYMPDKDRLVIMDLIVNTALSCVEGDEVKEPDEIDQRMIGWVKVLIEKIKGDYDLMINANNLKKEGINRRWAKAKGTPEPSEPQGNTPTPSEGQNTLQPSEAQNLNQWQREFYILIQRPEDEIICFCTANKLTCINAYIAWCATFIEAMKGKRRTHKDETDLIDHFNKWFYKLGMPKPHDKIERMTFWLKYYRNLWPEKSQLIPNVQEGGNMREYADYNREVAKQIRQAEAEQCIHELLASCKNTDTATLSDDDPPF